MYIKRILSLVFALVMVFSFVGCSQINEVTPTGSQTPPSSEDTTAMVTSTTSTVPTKTQPVLTPDITADTKAEIELTEEDMKLFKNSYDILFNRITDRGYAITSLTGTYVGMFTRDSAIQAMAHLSCNDSDSARSILR